MDRIHRRKKLKTLLSVRNSGEVDLEFHIVLICSSNSNENVYEIPNRSKRVPSWEDVSVKLDDSISTFLFFLFSFHSYICATIRIVVLVYLLCVCS
jgi:hypothetical protein